MEHLAAEEADISLQELVEIKELKVKLSGVQKHEMKKHTNEGNVALCVLNV